MSQVIIEFSAAPVRSGFGDAPLVDVQRTESEEKASSGTSQATTMTAPQAGWSCSVRNNGTDDIWVAFGKAPTAAVGTTHFVEANTRRDFGNLGVDFKAAVINDS